METAKMTLRHDDLRIEPEVVRTALMNSAGPDNVALTRMIVVTRDDLPDLWENARTGDKLSVAIADMVYRTFSQADRGRVGCSVCLQLGIQSSDIGIVGALCCGEKHVLCGLVCLPCCAGRDPHEGARIMCDRMIRYMFPEGAMHPDHDDENEPGGEGA